MLRHLPLLSRMAFLRDVDDLSQLWPLPGICYGAKVDDAQTYVPRY